MPFTLSHAAAVLPLRRRLPSLPLSAMVVGSMVPDFGFLIPGMDRHTSHSLIGLFTFCLPMGWLTQLILWHGLQSALLDLAPRPLQRRLQAVMGMERRDVVRVSCALLVGSVTHQVWDGFTHVDGFVAGALPWLRLPLFMVGDTPLRVCELLQHASSALGLVALAMYACRWFSRSAPGEARALQYRVFWLLVLSLVPIGAAVMSLLACLPVEALERAAAGAAARALMAGAVCLLAYALWWRLAKSRRGGQGSDEGKFVRAR